MYDIADNYAYQVKYDLSCGIGVFAAGAFARRYHTDWGGKEYKIEAITDMKIAYLMLQNADNLNNDIILIHR